ncbi:MAG: methyltransferase domain-containing protein [Candidatus Latescibacteria bacterium]|jgi:23S rRNA G2445 N2-methylase RlmL|nr:methyltransferase domain-containing protein [Candidatus Latescibacterota bacterium]
MSSIPIHTTTFRGLGEVTIRELSATFGSDASVIERHRVRDSDVTRLSFSGQVRDLYGLGTVEDLFYTLGVVPLTGKKDDLRALEQVAESGGVTRALHHTQRPSAKGRTTFRAVVQASDAEWRHYRRGEMQKAVERGIGGCFKKWRRVDDDARLEFWVQQAERTALVGLRLTDRTMRHRGYKVANMPASLRPTVARAMVLLAGVDAGDVVVDPTCGVGTVLIERALAGRYGAVLGGDIGEEAVRGAVENFGRRHRPRGICQWDATALPVRSGSADRIVCNLPWGRQVGSKDELEPLYTGVLREGRRILKPRGRAVFLTSEFGPFKRALDSAGGWWVREQLRDVRVLGRRADIFVVEPEEESRWR